LAAQKCGKRSKNMRSRKKKEGTSGGHLSKRTSISYEMQITGFMRRHKLYKGVWGELLSTGEKESGGKRKLQKELRLTYL